MGRSLGQFAMIPVIFALGSCSSVPNFDAPLDTTGSPTVASVVKKIRCEIAHAAAEPRNENIEFKDAAPFQEWKASVGLTLTVNDTIGTAQGGIPLSYINPQKITSYFFGFNANPVLYQNRTRTFADNYTIDISELKGDRACEPSPVDINLAGNLGLDDQIYMGLHAFEASDKSTSYKISKTGDKQGDNFGATILFHIYMGVTGAGPTWTVKTFKETSGLAGYLRDDLHQVVITFAPTAKSKQKVPVPKDPGPAKHKPTPELDSYVTTHKNPNIVDVEPGQQRQELIQKYLADKDVSPKEQEKTKKILDDNRAADDERRAILARRKAALEYNAKIESNNSGDSAVDVARSANANLQTYQAIQNLGVTLSRP